MRRKSASRHFSEPLAIESGVWIKPEFLRRLPPGSRIEIKLDTRLPPEIPAFGAIEISFQGQPQLMIDGVFLNDLQALCREAGWREAAGGYRFYN